MWQQQTLRNKQLNNHYKQDKNNKNTMFILYACVYVENIAMASWIKIWFVRSCVRVYMLGKSIESMSP